MKIEAFFTSFATFILEGFRTLPTLFGPSEDEQWSLFLEEAEVALKQGDNHFIAVRLADRMTEKSVRYRIVEMLFLPSRSPAWLTLDRVIATGISDDETLEFVEAVLEELEAKSGPLKNANACAFRRILMLREAEAATG